MNKQVLLSIVIFVSVIKTQAQVLYTETFDTFTLGNLGTDVTGVVPGQGGWLTTKATNANYAIIAEPNKGNVLSMFTNTPKQDTNKEFEVKKEGLKALINQKNAGNEVIKVEFDFYTGTQSMVSGAANGCYVYFYTDNPVYQTITTLFSFSINHSVGYINFMYNNGAAQRTILKNNTYLNFNTWYTFIVYLDYKNKAIYLEMPALKLINKGDFLLNAASTNIAQDFKIDAIHLWMNTPGIINNNKRESRYDNFKITALKDVPAHVLSTNEVLNEQFNVYPNPATNVVNVTNSANILVEQITVYDVAGKQISTQVFNNENQVQLNIENLPTGTYLFHIETDQGTAVKKIVKH